MDGSRRPTHVKTRRRTDRTNAPDDEAAVPEVEGKCGDEDNGEGRGAEATFCSGGMRGGGRTWQPLQPATPQKLPSLAKTAAY